MSRVRVSPFVPGMVHGVLRHHHSCSAGDILVLSPQELERLEQLPAGLIIVGGAPFAHPMIRLFSYGIPTVVISPAQAEFLRDGESVILDGYNGWVIGQEEAPSHPIPQLSPPLAGIPIQTADALPVELRASVASAAGVTNALAQGAAAIGMVRSEFLVPDDGTAPDEEFYVEALQPLCATAAGLPVTIRLLDLAPDKHPAWLGEFAAMSGPLGLRGARLYHHEPVRQVFLAELRAIARLAEHYPLRLLLPYMTCPEEFAGLQQAIHQAFPQPIPLGVMIETPAAALALPEWLTLVDFVVVGSNDLMQCLFAADRDIPAVASLLDPYAPVLYRFLQQMAQSADGQLHRLQLGGLLPQVPGILPLLIGMGFRNFSAEPLLIPCLATVVSACDSTASRELAAAVCGAHRAAEVRELLGLPPEFCWGSAG